jgi:hypothetical protein
LQRPVIARRALAQCLGPAVRDILDRNVRHIGSKMDSGAIMKLLQIHDKLCYT